MLSNVAPIPAWRKSSHSFSNGNCTEVTATGTSVLVRDSHLADGSPVLGFAPAEWAAFLATLKRRQGSGQA